MQLFQNLTSTTANTATLQFENALDAAYMDIISGAFSYQDAVKNAVKGLAKDGIDAIIYPTGHKDKMDVAVRRAVLTGVNQTAAKLSLARMEEMDCDFLETTAHPGARPSHAEWQGKIFSRSGQSGRYPDFVRSTGYGTGAGLCGWNCRHSFFPYFEGLSERAYSREKLKEYETVKVTYNGQELSVYEASQQQRYIERQIRRWKREYMAMDAAGADTTEASVKLAQWRAKQKDFINQTGLDEDNFRSQVYGFGRNQATKATWINKNYKKLVNDLRGIHTTTGVTITDTSPHVMDQATARGVSNSDIIDALTNTLKTGKIRTDKSQQFIGKHATVVINIDTGKVVTVWPTSSKKANKLKGES